jgi:hypothetical protein
MKQVKFGSTGLASRTIGDLSGVRSHLGKAAILAILGILLVWLIVSRALPYALAVSTPDLAL